MAPVRSSDLVLLTAAMNRFVHVRSVASPQPPSHHPPITLLKSPDWLRKGQSQRFQDRKSPDTKWGGRLWEDRGMISSLRCFCCHPPCGYSAVEKLCPPPLRNSLKADWSEGFSCLLGSPPGCMDCYLGLVPRGRERAEFTRCMNAQKVTTADLRI